MVIVLAANSPYLSGHFDANPLAQRSELASSAANGLLVGVNVLDPNDGFVSQALGHRAALDILRGHLPWWDPYEGAGAPLAGEMQSASLFPPTLLLALSDGQLLEHILLELLAGIGIYLLLRRLGVGRLAGVAGGAAFALDGTFAWFAHAPVNPIAFLPWLLLGVEWSYAATVRGRRGGWWLVAVALAASLYAGFPETAYIDGLLAIVWALWRCGCAGRPGAFRLVGKLAAGVGAGLLMAGPLLIAFGDTLAHSYTGSHAGVSGTLHLPPLGLPQLVLPYMYGPVLGFSDPQGQLGAIWGHTGGYTTILLAGLALFALAGRRHRGLKALLVVWLLLSIARMYHAPPLLGHVIGVLPEMSSIYFFRYAFPALELAVIVLAALGLDELRTSSLRRNLPAAVAGLALLVAAAAAAHGLVVHLSPASHSQWARAAVGWGALTLVLAIGLALVIPRRRTTLAVLSVLVVLDSAAMFVVRELAAPHAVRFDPAPVAFLHRHLGLGRFFTLGPIQPEYGAYFGLGSINDDDVPVPTAWTDYVVRRLDPTVNPLVFTGNYGGGRSTAGPSPAAELVSHLANYRAAGVSYVLSTPAQPLPGRPRGLALAARTPTAWIYRVSGASPYYSPAAGACSASDATRTHVTLACRTDTQLIRRELYFPGWHASVDGHPAPIGRHGIFQTVRVPRGRHVVSFSYAPPGIVWGWLALGAGWVFVLLGVARTGRPGRGTASGAMPSGSASPVATVHP